MTREKRLNGFRALMPALGEAVIAVSDSEAEISKPRARGLPRSGNDPKVVSRISPVDLLACPGKLEVSCRAQDCVWGGSGPELSRNLGHAGWLLPDVVPRRMVCHAFKANASLHFQDMTCKFLCLSRPYVPVKITCPRSLFLIC